MAGSQNHHNCKKLSDMVEVDFFTLNSEQQRAAKNIGENPGRVRDSLREIRRWLAENPHLNICDDEVTLIPFLRVCKYNIEKTRKRLENFYTVRSAVPEIFQDWDPFSSVMQGLLETGAFLPLPGTDRFGRSVIFLRFGLVPPSLFRVDYLFKLLYIIHAAWREHLSNLTLTGEVAINDLSGLSMRHCPGVSLSMLRKGIKSMQDCAPTRVKAIHYVKPYVFSYLFYLFKPLLKEKLRNRIHFHDDMDSLLQHFPAETIPLEYGGTGASLAELTEFWKKKVESSKEILAELENV